MKVQYEKPAALPPDASKSACKKYRLKMDGYKAWVDAGSVLPIQTRSVENKCCGKCGRKFPISQMKPVRVHVHKGKSKSFICLLCGLHISAKHPGPRPVWPTSAKPSAVEKRNFRKALKKWSKENRAWVNDNLATREPRKPDYPGSPGVDCGFDMCSGAVIRTQQNPPTAKALERYNIAMEKWTRKMKERGYTT